MSERVPLRSVLSGRRGGFLAALLLAEFAAAMQGIAYSTVLPVIADDLNGFPLFGATLAAGSIAAVLMLSFAPAVLDRVPPSIVLFAATLLYLAGAAIAVIAPAMEWVLAGTVVRDVAAGLFGGFGMGAIGTLFDARERPRVFGLFALVWLLPSIVGPPLNALIAEWLDWRWAIGWPAVLVVVARVLMGLTLTTVPWRRGTGRRVDAPIGIVVAVGLAVGAWGSATASPLGVAALIVGGLIAGGAIVAFLLRGGGAASRSLLAFALLCATYFGVSELLALTIVTGLGSTVTIASIAVGGGLLAWSLVGLRPRPDARPDPVVLGVVLHAVAITVILVAITLGGTVGVAGVITAAVLAGAGMGMAYPLLTSEPFSVSAGSGASDTSPPTTTVGALIAFAETSATAWSALVAGGVYSALDATGWGPRPALQIVFAVLAVLSIVSIAASAARRLRR
ncbi:MFS transporter [Leifsonia aquatica]|uniref:MFS transporter n=1 Tax=Leifsonia aquatica TaxID=144185 RepID=UPI00384D7941